MLFLQPPQDFQSIYDVVVVFLEHDDHFLMLKRQAGKPQAHTWCLPGGKVEEGESTRDAAVRELREETGVAAQPSALEFVYTRFARYPEYDFVFHLFRTRYETKPSITIDPACHSESAWVTPEESLAYKLIENFDEQIRFLYLEAASCVPLKV